MRQRGLGRTYQRGAIWWIEYSHKGVKHRESSGSKLRKAATDLLKKRLGEIGRGRLIGKDAERVTLAEILRLHENDYAVAGRRSPDRLKLAARHLEQGLGSDAKALETGLAETTAYAQARQEEGAALATVKYELSVLKRAYRLAVRSGLLPYVPEFPEIRVRNARSGFLDAKDVEAICAGLPPWFGAAVRLMFLTGLRKEEALNLEWRQIDLESETIRLSGSETKGGEVRLWPFGKHAKLRALILAQRAYVDAIQRARSEIVPWVFPRPSGERIRWVYYLWQRAAKAAGKPAALIHDLRRSFAREALRAGLPQLVAQRLGGWRSGAVFARYGILDEVALGEATERLGRRFGPGPSASDTEAAQSDPQVSQPQRIKPDSFYFSNSSSAKPAESGIRKLSSRGMGRNSNTVATAAPIKP